MKLNRIFAGTLISLAVISALLAWTDKKTQAQGQSSDVDIIKRLDAISKDQKDIITRLEAVQEELKVIKVRVTQMQ